MPSSVGPLNSLRTSRSPWTPSIVTKLLAAREKDIEDVRGVLSERGSALDVTQIRTTLGLLEDALGQSDLMPVFDHELGRWQRSEQ